MRLCTIRKSIDFRRLRGGRRFSAVGFLMEAKARPPPPPLQASASPDALSSAPQRPAPPQAASARFGFTVTRKLGGAVVRNRIRRRLKAAVRALDADAARPDHDYVIVARAPALDQPFAALAADIAKGVRIVDARQAGADAAAGDGRPARNKPARSKPARDNPERDTPARSGPPRSGPAGTQFGSKRRRGQRGDAKSRKDT